MTSAAIAAGFNELAQNPPSLNVSGWRPGVPGGIVIPAQKTYKFDGTVLFTPPAVAGTFFAFFQLNGAIITDSTVVASVGAGEFFSLHIERIFSNIPAGSRVSFGVLASAATTVVDVLSVFEATEVL